MSSDRRTRDGQDLTGNPRCIVRSEEHHGVRNILGRTHAAHGDAVDERLAELLRVACPLSLIIGARRHETGRYRIHGNAERTKLLRQLFDKPDLSMLSRAVTLDAGQTGRESGAARYRHNPPPTLAFHARRDGFGQQEAAVEIDVDDLPKRL